MRVVLPSCAVTKISNSFPSAAYAGFKFLQIELCNETKQLSTH